MLGLKQSNALMLPAEYRREWNAHQSQLRDPLPPGALARLMTGLHHAPLKVEIETWPLWDNARGEWVWRRWITVMV